ncbi:hypothetical protein J2S13_000269 [Oikeobacillus pervagus]|uniref:Uncharacterized protein n=1 Tax=Oikeobacillus pervagus TaxID=1325931 RepID=A0AAJ1T2W6_9BACI|nr:hypothetical protein [Oikeobacillus pervagus]MDQ0213875.1 hypothetical protein [Oikeobacillus pervagus]
MNNENMKVEKIMDIVFNCYCIWDNKLIKLQHDMNLYMDRNYFLFEIQKEECEAGNEYSFQLKNLSGDNIHTKLIFIFPSSKTASMGGLGFISPVDGSVWSCGETVQMLFGEVDHMGKMVQTVLPVEREHDELSWLEYIMKEKENYHPFVSGQHLSIFTFDYALASSETAKGSILSLSGKNEEALQAIKNERKNRLAFTKKK